MARATIDQTINQPTRTAPRKGLILGFLSITTFIIFLDMDVVNVALPAIARDFATTNSVLMWIANINALVIAGFLLVAGTTGDRLGRLKALATDGRTWSAMLYLLLQLPLGVIYFSLEAFMVAFSLGVMALPFAFMFGNPVIMPAGPETLALRASVSAVTEVAGFLMLTGAMHVIRGIGRFHGRYAQELLGL